MKKVKYIAILCVLLFLALTFVGCNDDTDKPAVDTQPYFSQTDYAKAVENGYEGTFAQYFLQHNQIERIEIVDKTVFAYLKGDIVVNLGAANLTECEVSYFSQEDYTKAVENGYKGTFSQFFLEHNQIEKIEIVDNTIFAHLSGDIVVNLGSANLTEQENPIVPTSDRYYFHLSFDDTMNSLKNLTSAATYESVFDEPFFGYLKRLHEQYGAKISLYTYLDVLDNVTDKYQSELGSASDWLKFGLHSTSHTKRFNKATYEDGYNAWTAFAKHIYRITGTFRSIDRFPRLHYWEGTEAALAGMRDAICGPLGFLSSEHEWPSYYLTKEQHLYAYNHEHLIDYKNGLVFVATDMRIDWFEKGYNSANVYRKPIKSSIYEELQYRFSNAEYASTLSSYLVFGHEWKMYDGKELSEEGKTWLDDICRFAFDNGIPFDFPQNKSYTPTPCDIH